MPADRMSAGRSPGSALVLARVPAANSFGVAMETQNVIIVVGLVSLAAAAIGAYVGYWQGRFNGATTELAMMSEMYLSGVRDTLSQGEEIVGSPQVMESLLDQKEVDREHWVKVLDASVQIGKSRLARSQAGQEGGRRLISRLESWTV